MISVVGCHAGGEVGNVIVGGVPAPPGRSVFEKMLALRTDDSLRRLLLREPRGSVAVHTNLLVPSDRPGCAAGFIIMEPTEYPVMSGSNAICVATVLLETGMVEMNEPVTDLKLETPGGVIDLRAHCHQGRCVSVELTNLPSFVDRLEVPLEVAGLGTLRVDLAFGGMWYAIVDAGSIGLEVEVANVRKLVEVGELVRVAARQQLCCVHPENDLIAGVSIVQIAGPFAGPGAVSKNAVVVAPGRLDRSPTGSGLCARMAALHARRLLAAGDSMRHASVLGTTFEGRILGETTVGGRPAIVPSVRGSAFITGVNQVLVDPEDPFPQGYLLEDTFPGADRQW
jgi:proline racemase